MSTNEIGRRTSPEIDPSKIQEVAGSMVAYTLLGLRILYTTEQRSKVRDTVSANRVHIVNRQHPRHSAAKLLVLLVLIGARGFALVLGFQLRLLVNGASWTAFRHCRA